MRPLRLTRDQAIAQSAATVALQTAHRNRADARKYTACIEYAARTIDATRSTIELVELANRNTDRAWRD